MREVRYDYPETMLQAIIKDLQSVEKLSEANPEWRTKKEQKVKEDEEYA